MKQSDANRLRKKVQECAKKGMPVSKIARHLGVSRPFVRKWKNKEDAKEQKRGWPKGRKRTYTDTQEKKVVATRQKLSEKFFLGRRRSRKN